MGIQARITFGSGVGTNSTGATPTTNLEAIQNPGAFGPNFDIGSPVAAPEPASLAPALVGLAMAGAAGALRRWWHRAGAG